MNYKKLFLNGAKWNTIKMVTTTFLQLLIILIVGKFIAPEEYGMYGMVNTFLGLAYTFADAGFSDIIIYKQENNSETISSLYWTNILVGFLLFIILAICSPLVSLYYRNYKLTKLIILASINFLIIPFSQIFISLSKKDIKFNEIAIIEISSTLIEVIATLVLAIKGYGVLALIYGGIIQSICSTLMYLYFNKKRYKIKFKFRYNDVKEFIKLGSYQLGSKLSNYLRSNVDYLIIGRFLGARELGIYTLAYQLVMVPIIKINPILTDTAYPIFVKFRDNMEMINNSYYKLLKTISFIIFPIIAGIFIIIPEFINRFYGAQWTSAILIIRIYCIVALIISLNNPIGCILYPKGRFDIALKWNLISAPITMILNLIGVKWGIIGVTISSTIYAAFISWPVDFAIRKFVSNMKIKDYFNNLKGVFISNILFIMLLLGVKYILEIFIKNQLAILILIFLIGLVVYLTLVFYFDKDVYTEVISNFKLKYSKN